ncbi:MAG: hypothetical protein IAF38_02805, partial [Bacteroidia bacterium]|nr:hypothetical protein [Bacteroidia bacterium]
MKNKICISVFLLVSFFSFSQKEKGEYFSMKEALKNVAEVRRLSFVNNDSLNLKGLSKFINLRYLSIKNCSVST